MVKPPMRLPLGARVADIVAREAASSERKSPSPTKLREQEAARQLIHASIHVPNPTGSKLIQSLDQDFEGAPMDLPVMAILCYDDNPRTEVNPEFEAIKESIRECGRIKQPITITRRPGRTEYMLAAGGNTRLRAIRELWLETNDPKFEKTTCMYVHWRGEAQILADHLIENEVRGEMAFWDKAVAISKLKKQMENDDGQGQSGREFEARLRSIGLPVARTLIVYYLFAAESLSPLGKLLNQPALRIIQPTFGTLRKFAAKHGVPDPDVSALFDKTISKCAVEANEIGSLDASKVVSQLELAVADRLGLDRAQFSALMMAHAQFPTLSISDLKVTVQQTSVSAGSGDQVVESPPADTKLSEPLASPLVAQTPLAIPPAANHAPPIPQGVLQRSIPALGIIKSREQLLAEKTQAFTKACETYAVKHTVVAQFVLQPSMPLGFYMEFPASSFVGLANSEQRILAWWFLASLSMQRQPSVVEECIPEQSKSLARKFGLMGDEGLLQEDGNRPEFLASLFGEAAPCWDLSDFLNPDFHAMRAGLPLLLMYHELVDLLRIEPGQAVGN